MNLLFDMLSIADFKQCGVSGTYCDSCLSLTLIHSIYHFTFLQAVDRDHICKNELKHIDESILTIFLLWIEPYVIKLIKNQCQDDSNKIKILSLFY